MELKQIIEMAEKATGSQKELSEKIGQSPSRLRDAKSGRCGLPNYACVMIADLIGMERIAVIAASELITEKKEERRKVWFPFVGKTAALGVAWAVTLNMTPYPAYATEMLQVTDSTVYIMSNR
jgi:hypothetical protein